MLAARDYVDAGIELIGDTGGLIRGSFSKPAVTATALVLVVVPIGAVVALLAADHQAASKVTGSVLSVVAALGISWTSLRATLGKALAKAEQPLWQVELDTAIAEAITVLPTDEASLHQLFDFPGVGPAAPGKRATASVVAAERLPRGPEATQR